MAHLLYSGRLGVAVWRASRLGRHPGVGVEAEAGNGHRASNHHPQRHLLALSCADTPQYCQPAARFTIAILF